MAEVMIEQVVALQPQELTGELSLLGLPSLWLTPDV